MPSNREAYFAAIQKGVSPSIVKYALMLVNNYDSFSLTLHFDDEISNYSNFCAAIDYYLNGGMIEHYFGKASFLSHIFFVSKDVLIPRQETEQLVIRTKELIKEYFPEQNITIADVCTGSGCIGISLALSLPSSVFYLTDVSEKALQIASKNAVKLLNSTTKIEFRQGNMLNALDGNKVDVIVCNPPYIDKMNEIDSRTFSEEPHLALLASPNTYFYEEIFLSYKKYLNESFLLAFEIGEDMEKSLTLLMDKYFDNCSYWFEKDIYDKTRFLFIKN